MSDLEFRNMDSAIDYLEEKYEGSSFDVSKYGIVEDSVSVSEIGDKIIVASLRYDEAPMDYFENDEGAGEFFEFRNVDDRDEKVDELKTAKKLFYLVDKYEHGNVHYSVSKTHNYPDQRWDVAHGCAIFVPCSYIQDEYQKEVKKNGKDAAYEKYISDSNSVLESYSSWRNGEVYGYSVVGFSKAGEEVFCDECWGFIGHEYAEAEKTSVLKHYVEKEALDTTQTKKMKI